MNDTTKNIIAYEGPLGLFNWVDGSKTHCKVTFSIPSVINPFKRFVVRDKERAGQRFHTVLVRDNEATPCWEGELLLIAWNSSGSKGHTATFMVAPENGENPFSFFISGKNGDTFACAMVELGDDEKPVTQPKVEVVKPATVGNETSEISKPFGQYATLLYRSGWLVRTETLNALGGVEVFRDWVRKQSCCVNEKDHDVRIIPRTLEPGDPWAIAPMCFAHKVPPVMAKSWKRKYAQMWARETLSALFNAKDGLGSVEPALIHKWAKSHDLHTFLPNGYFNELNF